MKFRHLKGDFFGGLTAGIVALPLALAFGVQSGLGPAAGLYGAIGLGIVAALVGGAPTQISGPTGPVTVIVTVAIVAATKFTSDPVLSLGLVFLTFFLSGIFQILFGVAGIGKYIRYIPYPVLSGFMTGVGLIIITFQLFPLFGELSPKTVIETYKTLPDAFDDINFDALLLSSISVAIIYLFPYITKKVPSTLIALIVGSIIAAVFKLDVSLIGEIPSGFPSLNYSFLSLFTVANVKFVMTSAFMIAAVSALDSLMTATMADNMTKTKHNSNRELVGQGLGAIAASLIGGIPGCGAAMRTYINVRTGGRTQLSGIIHGLVLLVILVALGPYAEHIPLPVLSGILITVGLSIIDYKSFRHILHIPRADAIVMITVIILTVFVDLIEAVAIGMMLASVLFMKEMSDITEGKTEVASITKYTKELPWVDEEEIPKNILEKVYIKHLYGPVFFGFASQLTELVRKMPNIEAVVIRMERVPYIDQSGLYALEDAILELTQKKIEVAICGIKGQPLDMLRRVDIIPALVPEEDIFDNFTHCYQWIKKKFLHSDSKRKHKH